MVVATDGGNYDAKSTSIPVEISLTDVNDNAPIFEETPFRATIPITTQPGHNVLQVRAKDADAGVNGEIIYAFLHEQDKPKFRIHPNSGVVTATTSLTQDYGKTYHLEIVARDRGNSPKSTTGLIELRVGNNGDTLPNLRFQNDTYEVIVTENSPIGMEIAQVTAVRSDGRRQHVSYSIAAGNDYQTFVIDVDSGMVKINDPTKLDAEWWINTNNEDTSETTDHSESWKGLLDTQQRREQTRERSKRILTLVARTIGSEPLEAYAKLIIYISDVNDNPPIFTQTQYSATVLEGNAKETFVVRVRITNYLFK